MSNFTLKQGIFHAQSKTYLKEVTMFEHTLQTDIKVDRILNKMRKSKNEDTRLDAESDLTQELVTFMCLSQVEGLETITIEDMQSISRADHRMFNHEYFDLNQDMIEEMEEEAKAREAKKSSAGKT